MDLNVQAVASSYLVQQLPILARIDEVVVQIRHRIEVDVFFQALVHKGSLALAGCDTSICSGQAPFPARHDVDVETVDLDLSFVS